jgi:hypothetical protein
MITMCSLTAPWSAASCGPPPHPRECLTLDARVRLSRVSHADPRLRGDARGRDGGVREELAAGVTAPMFDDPDAIYFPEAEIMPSLAMAFMRMMFAHFVGKGEGGSPCPAGSSLSAQAARPSWAAIRSRISNKRSQSH